jgi:hypothetical protein
VRIASASSSAVKEADKTDFLRLTIDLFLLAKLCVTMLLSNSFAVLGISAAIVAFIVVLLVLGVVLVESLD